MKDNLLNEDLGRYFHLFWDNAPFPVMIIKKDRTIMDRNKAAEAVGGCDIGTRCIDRGGSEMHKGCLADLALREQTAKRSVQYVEQMEIVMDSYWIPLPGYQDLFLHFGLDITTYATDSLKGKPAA